MWNFLAKDLFTGEFKVPKNYKIQKEYHLYRNKYNWMNFLNAVNDTGNTDAKICVHAFNAAS